MKKPHFLLQILYLAVFQSIIAQPLAAEVNDISLWANEKFQTITDMSKTQIAVVDAREKPNDQTLDLFRRYDDNARLTDPSVLERQRKPTHFFVLANNIGEAKAEAQKMAKYDAPNTLFSLVLAGELHDTDTIPSVFDCLFHLPAANEKSIDLLVQAAFNGVEVAMAKELTCASNNLRPRQQSKTRLSYGKPEDVGMDSETLAKIDNIMQKAINSRATPGGYVLVARRGMVVMNKAYGRTNYQNGQRVNNYHLYDLASLSKVLGTLPVVMQLYEEGELMLTDKIGRFFPRIAWEKQQISIEQLLLHSSGLPTTIPSFLTCVDTTTLKMPVYSSRRKNGFSVQIEPRLFIRDGLRLRANDFSDVVNSKYENVVARNLFATNNIKKLIYNTIDNSKLLKPTYRYSDLNFIYLQRIAEQITHRDLDVLFRYYIANPLGLRRLTYCPLRDFELRETVPTENDRYFRHQQVQGTVHDQMAALLGGVAGNAGLFGTANEIAKLAQMYLNGGSYGGVQFFSVLTINKFTSRQSDDNRRGLGFDKPEFRAGKDSPVSYRASLDSYGHSGFSGTLFWIDPQEELIYIFLSNRICPDAFNNRLTSTNVRTNIQEIIYEAIER